MNWIEGLVSKNSIVDFILVFASEGRLLQEHLIDQNTKRPPVDSSTIFLVK